MKSLVVVSMLLLAVSGCSDSHLKVSDAQARSGALESLENRRDSVSTVGNYADGLADYLPGQLASIDGSDPAPLAAGVVHGTISNVRPHGAYRTAKLPSGEEDPDGEPVDFSDPDADWRMIAVTLEIADAWGQDVPTSGQVRFVLPADNDSPNEFMQGIEALGEIVVVLSSPYQLDDSLYRVAESDAAIGLVDDSGILSFPILGADARRFVRDARTVEELAGHAYERQALIVVEDFQVVSK